MLLQNSIQLILYCNGSQTSFLLLQKVRLSNTWRKKSVNVHDSKNQSHFIYKSCGGLFILGLTYIRENHNFNI